MRYPCSGTTVSCRQIGGFRSSGTAVLPHENIQKHYLTKIGYTSDRDRNQIANFTYLDYNTNIDISDDSPAEYVDRYRQKLGEDGYRKTCSENALPIGFEKISYPDFLDQRRRLMAGIVKQAFEKLCQ